MGTSQRCSVSRILTVKEILGLQQQAFPILSMIAIINRKNIFRVDALGLKKIVSRTYSTREIKKNEIAYVGTSCY